MGMTEQKLTQCKKLEPMLFNWLIKMLPHMIQTKENLHLIALVAQVLAKDYALMVVIQLAMGVQINVKVVLIPVEEIAAHQQLAEIKQLLLGKAHKENPKEAILAHLIQILVMQVVVLLVQRRVAQLVQDVMAFVMMFVHLFALRHVMINVKLLVGLLVVAHVEQFALMVFLLAPLVLACVAHYA